VQPVDACGGVVTFPEYVNCTSCGSAEHRQIATTGMWGVRRCHRCTMLFVSPRPTPEATEALYDKAYFDGTGSYGNRSEEGGYQANAAGYRARAEQIIRWLISLTHVNEGRSLDVGCGPGYMVAAANEAGFHGIGVDISAAAVRYGVEVMGLELYRASAEQLMEVADPPFTIVTMMDTLFHLRDPRAVLKQVWALLAPGGYLFAGPFDLGSADTTFQPVVTDVSGWGIPEHLSFVNRTSMTYLLGELGFDMPRFLAMPLTPSDLTARHLSILPMRLRHVLRIAVRLVPQVQRSAHALASRAVNRQAGYALAQKPR
jgi:SAM-dependent methyltransferase